MNPSASNFDPSAYAGSYGSGNTSGGGDEGAYYATATASESEGAAAAPYIPSSAMHHPQYDPYILNSEQYGGGGGGTDYGYDTGTNLYDTNNYGSDSYRYPSAGSTAAWSPEYQQEQPVGMMRNEAVDLETITAPGSYYDVSSFRVFDTPTPVSAVAYDETYDALYACGVTTLSYPHHNHHHHYHNRSSSNVASSMRMTYDCSSGNGIGGLYASIACHPQAPAAILNGLYASLYGTTAPTGTALPSSPSSPLSSRQTSTIPHHAYQPPYGHNNPALDDGLRRMSMSPHSPSSQSSRHSQMGVTTLTPLAHGTTVSVSPSGVRLHMCGGAALATATAETTLKNTACLAGTPHPGSSNDLTTTTHYTVGGGSCGSANDSSGSSSSSSNSPASSAQQLAATTTTKPGHQLHCLDVWQGLRVVSSHRLGDNNEKDDVTVTCLATSHAKRCVTAGATDGHVYLVDDRSRTLARLKSHLGGVVDVAVSDDGTLVATTGYGSKAATATRQTNNTVGLHAFPDPTVLVYDIRCLGRGGFPHPFSGVRGGPRHVAFCPDVAGEPSNRLVAVSGQAGGGCQIIVPFQEQVATSTSFLQPMLERGEAVSCLCVSEDRLALGTTQGQVLQYRMAGYNDDATNGGLRRNAPQGGIFIPSSGQGSRSHVGGDGASSLKKEKRKPLEMPSYEPPPPALSIDASILLKGNETNGITNKSVFSAYILAGDPSVSSIGDPIDRSRTSYGPLATQPLLAQSKLQLSADLRNSALQAVDFMETIPLSKFDINVLEDHRPNSIKERDKKEKEVLSNPNKFIYTNKLYKCAYAESFNRTKRYTRQRRRGDTKSSTSDDSGDDEDGNLMKLPSRYSLTLRPSHKSAASYNHGDYNKAHLVPGYDYPMTLPNAFVPPVLLLLYCIPELKNAVLKSQSIGRVFSKSHGLLAELGFLFHRIEALTRNALLFPIAESKSNNMIQMDAWAPISLISILLTMPEAERFQILDGSPAAVESPRRPEAFFRFLLYQLDKEIDKGQSKAGLIDSLCGSNFVSINEFVSGSGPPTKSTGRNLTVDMSYDYFLGPDYKSKSKPCFADVLQHNLCSAKRLRAWSQGSKSYETIVQRKIITCLPTLLSLSAACAGRKESDGLSLWKENAGDNNLWLPEMVEVEIQEDGSVVVRELVHDEKTGSDSWKDCLGKGSIPSSISAVVKETEQISGPRKRKYRLDAVVSMIRDDLDKACPEEVRALDTEGPFGHHVLHIRVPKETKRSTILQQRAELETFMLSEKVENISDMTLLGRTADTSIFQDRLDHADSRVNELDEETKEPDKGSEWVLVNGFVVSKTVVEDARAFHVKFKEPSLIVFRAIDELEEPAKPKSQKFDERHADFVVPPEVIRTSSISNAARASHAQKPNELPGKGDLVAFDAEFVAVAEEESTLTVTGSKVTIRETRHALARISVIDGRQKTRGNIVFDDHVQPNEEVVDYLTRFSGIVAQDLDPKQSRHHLISSRAAYLKLRCMVERGCIFVGHGLRQDFWTANLAVPASQIIDTVDIFHKPAQRFISLRFLTNFVLKRDMQQDIHDSVEDSLAAFELYERAIELKRSGMFLKTLDELYEFGQKNDWKLGVNDDDG